MWLIMARLQVPALPQIKQPFKLLLMMPWLLVVELLTLTRAHICIQAKYQWALK
jgi:hypothetical protein